MSPRNLIRVCAAAIGLLAFLLLPPELATAGTDNTNQFSLYDVHNRRVNGSTQTALPTTDANGVSENVLRDNVRPAAGASTASASYSTAGAGAAAEVAFGYHVDANSAGRFYDSFTFQERLETATGGFFASAPRIQILGCNGWQDIAVTWDTPYPGANGISFETFTATFTATPSKGIRIIGAPGGSGAFVTAAEVRVTDTGAISTAGVSGAMTLNTTAGVPVTGTVMSDNFNCSISLWAPTNAGVQLSSTITGGTVTFDTLSITFTPASGFTGTTSFSFSWRSIASSLVTRLVTVNVAAATPTPTPTATATSTATPTPTPQPDPPPAGSPLPPTSSATPGTTPPTPPLRPSEPVRDPTVTRTDEVRTTIAPTTPAQMTSSTPGGARLTLDAPAGALPAGASLTLAAVTNLDALLAQAPLPANANLALAFVVEARGASGDAITGDFAAPVALTFEVPANTLPPGADSGQLVLAFWSGTNWVEVPAAVSVGANGVVTLTGSVGHFTLFSIAVDPNRGKFVELPAPRTQAMTLWRGGAHAALASAVGTSGGAVWVTMNGEWLGYIPGAPDEVNRAFLIRFPFALPANTPVLVIRRRVASREI